MFVVPGEVEIDNLVRGWPDALGLGLALADGGSGVRIVTSDGLASIKSADVVVSLDPDLDPSLMPSGATKVAWAASHIATWIGLTYLPAFDLVLCPTPLALIPLRKRTPRARLFPTAVDTTLFGPGVRRRRRHASSVVPIGGALRPVHKVALRRPDLLTLFSRANRNARPEIKQLARVRALRFDLPDLFALSAVVVDELDDVERGFGIVSRTLLEAAACGAVPITNGSIGVHDLGLDGIPTFRTDRDLAETIESLLAKPSALRHLASDWSARIRVEHSTEVRAAEFLALLSEDNAPPAPRHAIHVAPDYSQSNAYQTMLYSSIGSADAYTVPVEDPTTYLRARTRSGREPGVLHLHRTDPILRPASTEVEARECLESFTAALDGFLTARGKLLWTIHSVLPTDTKFPDLEVELANRLVARAHLVHLLSGLTLEATAPYYVLNPDRTLIVERSSYSGMYPDWISRVAARTRLGLLPDDKVLVLVGGIWPHSDISRLLDVFDEMVEDDPALRLVIAGPPLPEGVAALERRCVENPRVTEWFRHVPDSALQVLFGAADVAVLPDVNTLSSSAFQLAISFGVPVVGPRRGALLPFQSEPYTRLFDPTSVADLQAVLAQALRDFPGNHRLRSAARAAAEARAPEAMAAEFAAAVAGLIAE